MSAILNTISFEDTVDLVNREFDTPSLPTIPNVMRESRLFRTNSIPYGTGGTRRHKERPVGDLYASYKAEGGRGTYTRVQQGYYKDTTSRTFSKMLDITLEMRTLNKEDIYDEIKNTIGQTYQNREDLNMAMFLSYASDTSYTDQDGQTVDISCGDGLAIQSASHTLTGSTTTFTTVVPSNPDFAEGSLEVAEDTLRTNIYDNLGNQRTCRANVIYTTDYPTTVNEVARVIQSTAQISAPNAGVTNVYKGRYEHKILPKMNMSVSGDNATIDSAKNKFWILADTNLVSFYHDVYKDKELVTPEFGDGKNIETLNWTWHVVGMHGTCAVSPRGLVMSRPS